MEDYLRSFAQMVFMREGMPYELVIVRGTPVVWVDGWGEVRGEIDYTSRRVILYLPPRGDLRDAMETILHEVAHFKAGPEHGAAWRDALAELRRRYGYL
jgi:hypothetical protein